MPQPLSHYPKASIPIGNSNDSPSHVRPQVALAAMSVIAGWSILESFVSSFFVDLLGANPAPAAAIYSVIRSEAAQKDALRAVAGTRLSDVEMDLLEAVFSVFDSAAKGRNKVAHWVWGYANEIADGVLLCNPRDFMQLQLDERDGSVDLSRQWREKIYVFDKADFESMARDINRAMDFVVRLRFLIDRGHPWNRGDELFVELCNEPEIQRFLTNLSERRKKSLEAQKPLRP